MFRVRLCLMAVFVAILPLAWTIFVSAQSSKPRLVISQFKVTTKNGQFFMLHNASDSTIDMGTVQLVYYNNYNLTDATSSKVIGLEGALEPGGYYLINDGPYTLCYQMLVNSINLGLSTTAGSLYVQELTQQEDGPITIVQHDFVNWSKKLTAGINQLPSDESFLLRQPIDQSNNPDVVSLGEGSWLEVSPDAEDPCQLTHTEIGVPPSIIETSLLLLSSTPPPVTILSRLADIHDGPYMPTGNIGLLAPVVNELLANPGSPKTDANDEFIELYNPNDKPFELTGFKLQVGVTTKRTYTFPAGTILKPKSFTAFFSDQTRLALSNTGSKAELLDPFGGSISASKDYTSAKEDQAWALANNEWLLTTTPTPGEANVITGDASASGQTTSSTSNRSLGSGSSQGNNDQTLGSSSAAQVADIHPTTLAGVAALAVGYGAYEYRYDLQNRYRQFRRYRASRRTSR